MAANGCVTDAQAAAISTDYPTESAREIDYSSVETSSGSISSISVANSNTFSYLFLDAAVGCNSNKDPAKCNTLANLCVLQLYNEQATVCQLFQFLISQVST